MLNRRHALGAIAVLSTGLAAHARAASASDAASDFIKTTADKLVGVINGAGTVDERRKLLAPILNSAVDMDGVARFCLGRFWRVATPAQQQQFLALFRTVLVANIAIKLGDYRGVKLTITRTQHRDEGELVSTTIVRPNNPATNIQWLIANATTDPKVIDVIAEGTSLRLTQREDYGSFLASHGSNIDALLEALRHQAQQGV